MGSWAMTVLQGMLKFFEPESIWHALHVQEEKKHTTACMTAPALKDSIRNLYYIF